MAIGASNITTVSNIYKRLYYGKPGEDVATRDHVWLDMLTKKSGFTGSDFRLRLQYNNPQGVATTVAAAQTGATSSSGVQWAITRAKRYGVLTLDGESMLAAQDNAGAFITLVKNETDGLMRSMGQRAANDVYGNGSGSIGNIGASPLGAAVITLTAFSTSGSASGAGDAKNFFPGQILQLAPTATGTGDVVRGGTLTVLKTDEDAGTVTLTGNISAGVAAAAANDYIFGNTDLDAVMKGLAAWIPLTAPTGGDSFFGFDRSVQPTRLAGARLATADATNSIAENFLKLGAKVWRQGGRGDTGLLSPINWQSMVKELGSKDVREPDKGNKTTVGYQYVTVNTAAGQCKVYPDPDCPDNVGYLLTESCWFVKYLSKNGAPFIHIIMDDGNESLRQTADDGVEVRARYLAQLCCEAPAWNGMFPIA